MGFYANFITKESVDHLVNHKYKSGGKCIVDELLQPFYDILLKHVVPETLAPNTISFLGAFSMFFSAVLFVVYDPTLNGSYPTAFYIIAALGVFAYQTLDNLDGQQARKIGACSPLGQLIDHGLDSFTASSFIILLVCCLGLEGDCFYTWLLMLINLVGIFLANTEEYYTGVFNIQIEGFGVTEIQTLLIGLCLVNAYGGGEKGPFTYTLNELLGNETPSSFFFYNVKLYWCVLGLAISASLLHSFLMLQNIIKSERDKDSKLKNFVGLITVIVAMGLFTFNRDLVKAQTGWIFLSIGFIGSLNVCKVIICSVCGKSFPWLLLEGIIPITFFFIIKFRAEAVPEGENFNLEYIVGAMFGLSFYFFYDFTSTVMLVIAKELDIWIFTLKPKKQK